MPKLKYTKKKGLHQLAGSGEVDLNGEATLKGGKSQIITLSGAGATKTLTAADSGALVVLSGSNASTVTLPAVSNSGAHFVFHWGTSVAHVVTGGATAIQGAVWDNTNGTTLARTAVLAKSSITAANPLFGDNLSMWSDGTNWHVHGWMNDTPTLG